MSTTASGVLGRIILGNNTTCNTSDQLILLPTVTTLNVLGLVSSMGTGMGTILEYHSSKNIIPSTGTYNRAINNKFVNCFFLNGETGLLIGDGTNSYVQGISVSNCIFVGCVTCVKWYQGTGTLADLLIMTGCQFGGSNTQININNILPVQPMSSSKLFDQSCTDPLPPQIFDPIT